MLRKIVSMSFWLLVGNTIGKVTMFVTNILVARILSQELFGQFSMIRSAVNIGTSIVRSTLGLIATKDIAAIKQAKDGQIISYIFTIFLLNFIFVLLIIIAILIFSQWIISSFFLGQIGMRSALYIGLIILLVSSLSTLVQSFLIGFEFFRIPAILSAIVTCLSIPIIYFLINLYGLYGALFSVAIYFLFDSILKLSFLTLRIRYPNNQLSLRSILFYAKSVLSFSLPLTLAISCTSLTFWYARTVIVNSTQAFSDIAIFDAAYQWLTIIMLITGATTNVALPLFSKSNRTGEKDGTNRIFKLNLIVNLVISVGIAFVFILFSKQIMQLYGTQYIKGFRVLVVLSITSILFTVSSLLNKYMLANNSSWTIFWASTTGIIAMLIVVFTSKYSDALRLSFAFLAFYLSTIIIYFSVFIYQNGPRKSYNPTIS